MLIIKSITEMRKFLEMKNMRIGFVPTMGALHQGHISLIDRSKSENELTVCSIFVNPTQFNDPEDFEKYPITLEADIEKLVDAKTDMLFLPLVADMYPNGTANIRQYEIGFLNTVLDGEHRPGHFNGVCAIVHLLLNAVKPHSLYLGEKDFQQCLVIKQMITQEKISCEVITCPTLRATNGLAMSSRNQRLSDMGKVKAGLIYECMLLVKNNFSNESFEHLKIICEAKLFDAGFETEYFQLADANTLQPLISFDVNKHLVLLVASKLEGVRLIDNMRLN
jgi:pantoate--beta-alanine ligase